MKMEQAKLVWGSTHMEDRQDKGHNILLCQIDKLFVEGYYHREYNVSRKFEAYNEHDLLHIYLPKN